MNVIRLIFLILLISSYAHGQENLKELPLWKVKRMAKHADRLNDPYHAIDFYGFFLSRKDNYNVRFRLAELYIETRDYKQALNELKRLQNKYPNKHDLLFFRKAQVLKSMGLYDKAVQSFSQFRNDYRGSDKNYYRKRAKLEIEGCELIHEEIKQDERFLIEHLEGTVNNAHLEFSPQYFSGKLLYGSLKTNELVFEDSTDIPDRKLYLAEKKMKFWRDISEPNLSIPDGLQLGSFCVNQAGDKIFLSLCKLDWQHRPQCEIYVATRSDMDWTVPKRLPKSINDGRSSNLHPSIGYDPRKEREILYFVSDRKGGKGKLDIWYSRWNPRKNDYDDPRNCGSKVNSTEDERTPFYDLDNSRLYFSSDGHPGLGGYDVFVSLGNRRKWTEPDNLGKQFNSSFDELDFIIKDNKGFFVSNRTGTIALKSDHCCDDVFSFERKSSFENELKLRIYELPRRTELSETVDSSKSKLLTNMDFEVDVLDELLADETTDSESEEEDERRGIFLRKRKTDESGLAKLSLDVRYNYRFLVDDPRYFYAYSDLGSGWDEKSNVVNIYVNRIGLEEIVIPNIYYPFDEYYLTADAKRAIDTTVYEVLIENPNIIIEIGSHTDSKGSFNYNINLSNNRARSVVNHLRKKGIDRKRLTYRGYGESKPLVSNTKEDGSDDIIGRAKNRRTSFKVIGILKDGEKIIFDKNFSGIKADR